MTTRAVLAWTYLSTGRLTLLAPPIELCQPPGGEKLLHHLGSTLQNRINNGDLPGKLPIDPRQSLQAACVTANTMKHRGRKLRSS